VPRLPLCLMVLVTTLAGYTSACAPSSAGRYRLVQAERTIDSELARNRTAEGLRRFDAGDLAGAEDLLEQALEADVTYGPAHNNLGRVYHETGRLYRAAWEYQYAIRLMPHHPDPKNNLGLVLESVHRLDESVEQYAAALKLAPDHPEYIGNLVRAKMRRGDSTEEVTPLLHDLVLKDERVEWREWGNMVLMQRNGALQP